MAIYRLETKIIGRRAKDKAGKPIPGHSVSVVAKAAYRAGDRLRDEQTERTYNYRARSQEVVHSEIVAPANAPGWLTPPDEQDACDTRRERLWNEVERAEKRVDSQLAREFVIALPHELDHTQQADLVRHWCEQQVTSRGFVADFAIHRSKDDHNPHSHVLCTLRPVEGEGFGRKPDMSGKFNERGEVGQGAKSDLIGWRESWELHCNAALEAAGIAARVDHRSLVEQGIDREPEPKIGVEATAMQRRGADDDPERVRKARQVRMGNQLRSAIGDARAAREDGDTAETVIGWRAALKNTYAYLASEFRDLLHDESSGGQWPTNRYAAKDANATGPQASDSPATGSPVNGERGERITPSAEPCRDGGFEPEPG